MTLNGSRRAGALPLAAHDQFLPDARGDWLSSRSRKLLARILAVLDDGYFAENLDQLVQAAALGKLPCDAETMERIRDACVDVRLIHDALMQALSPGHERPARAYDGSLEDSLGALNTIWRRGER